MIAASPDTDVERFAAMIGNARRLVPFTGAGISTECGIPDFRSPGGFWTQNRPISFDDFRNSQAMRDESWRRRFALEEKIGPASPGRGHRAIAALYRRGQVSGVITQNIDNLHQASGVPVDDIVELHGNTTYAACLDCGRRYEIEWVRTRFDTDGHAPDCVACGGHIKTATISFGQSMPQAQMQRADELTRGCDLFIAIGSSLVVWPAAGFPLRAKRSGARLVIINREETELDEMADLVIHADIGDVLARVVSADS